MIGPALIITVGLEVLKTAGQIYFNLSSSNPAYTVVAGAVGMLLFLKLMNVLILYAAAHAATSGHGTVVDLANGQRVESPRLRPPGKHRPIWPPSTISGQPHPVLRTLHHPRPVRPDPLRRELGDQPPGLTRSDRRGRSGPHVDPQRHPA